MDIFEGQDKLDPAPKQMIRKPRRSCKKCSGTGSLIYQETIKPSKLNRRSLFGPSQRVLCPCVKVVSDV